MAWRLVGVVDVVVLAADNGGVVVGGIGGCLDNREWWAGVFLVLGSRGS